MEGGGKGFETFVQGNEFFEKEHEQLRNDGEEGMRNTASSFMVVATLIDTIMFNGQPAGGFSFENSNLAVASSISSSVGLLCSSTALMMFLSILTSRYSCKDFIQSLPLRFLSILMSRYPLIPILFFLFACLPILYGLLKYRLLSDLVQSTYCSSSLFQPRRRLLC